MRFARRHPNRQLEAVIEDDALPAHDVENPEDIDVLRTAIELASARSAASSPSEAFVTALGRRLGIGAPETEAGAKRGGRTVSRRALLTASVAAGVVGGVTERLLTAPGGESPPRRVAEEVLSPSDGAWTPVTLDSDPATGVPGRFATADVAGFVSEQHNELVAVSGVCTHLGCLLRTNDNDGRLDCPCHRTAFSYGGEVLFSELPNPPGTITSPAGPSTKRRRRGTPPRPTRGGVTPSSINLSRPRDRPVTVQPPAA